MVGHEQSIKKGISTFLSFSAKSVEPELLEQLLIGRGETADLLTRYARQIVSNGQNHQIILIGPRGSGKTHMLSVLFHRLSDVVKKRELIVAYFAEEELGIDGYLDFLIRIINSFKRWYSNDSEKLEEKLELLRETIPVRQESLAEEIITGYIGTKPLLILTENFDETLRAIGTEGQNKLRAFLYRHNRTSIIATSQALNPDLKKEDKPFYNFFTTILLKRLSYTESLSLLQQLATIEGKPELIEHLKKKGRSQIKAIHRLVKGNHRLLVTFFEFLKADSLADLSSIFIKTMNDLKPYFETFVRYLPPLQQKIIHYLALSKSPKRGTEICKHCFISDKSISKTLSELQRRKLIDAITDPESKRDKLYDISEPLLRIAIEIGEQKQGITSLFIDFLAMYYSEQELTAQKNKFESLYLVETSLAAKQKYLYEIQARELAMELKSMESPDPGKSTSPVEELYIQKKYTEIISYFKKSKPVTEGDYFMLAYSFSEMEDFGNAVKYFKKANLILPNKLSIILNIGIAYLKLNNIKGSVSWLERAYKVDPYNIDVNSALCVSYYHQKKFDNIIRHLNHLATSSPLSEDLLIRLAIAYWESKHPEKAFETFAKAISINPHSKDAWHGLALNYTMYGDHEKAKEAFINLLPLDIENAYIGIFVFLKIKVNSLKKVYLNYIEIMNSTESYDALSGIITKRLKKKMSLQDVNYYKEVIQLLFERPEQLTIAETFLNVYEKIQFNGEEKALYTLPKEQREFFEQEILGRNRDDVME